MSGSIVRVEVVAPNHEDPHRASIESDFFSAGWWGACACEWKGPVRHSVTDVMRDVRDHFDEADS